MPISWEIRKTLEPSSRSSRGSIDCSKSKLDRECSPFALPTRDISWDQGFQKVVDFLPTGSMQKSVPHFLTLSPHSICGFTSPWAGWHNGDCFADSFVGRGFSRDTRDCRQWALAPEIHMNTRQEKAAILVVEDEAKMRRLLELQLGEEGFLVHSAADAEAGLQLLVREKPDLVVTDLRLPGMSGLEFLQAVKRVSAALPVVVMTAYGTGESAVEAMKDGASDYVTKPFSLAELVLVIRKELDSHRLREENRSLREALGRRYAYDNIVAQSDKMQAVL